MEWLIYSRTLTLSKLTIIWDLGIPILSDTMDIVRSERVPGRGAGSTNPKSDARVRVCRTHEWHQRTRAEAGSMIKLTLRGWRRPQPLNGSLKGVTCCVPGMVKVSRREGRVMARTRDMGGGGDALNSALES